MKRFCIIGAGASGLAVAKTFAERGIAFDCFEALADVGGIWNPESPHVVYGSTYLNSSKKLSRYPDFHFPEEWAHYASRAQAQDYLRAYAKEFGLYKLISFNKRVTRAEHTRARLARADRGRERAALLCRSGHRQRASLGGGHVPTYPGQFDGEMLHSHDVKSKEQVKGKRVLVVGAGNSAVDILSDAAIENGRVVHSMRRTYYFFPKTVFGKPTDVFIDYTSRIPLPRKLMRLFYRWGMRIVVGPHRRFGLERPDHDLFEAHPTACNTYIDHLIHGRTIVQARHRAARRQARHLHRRQRGGDRLSGLGHGLPAELPVHRPAPTFSTSRASRSCSSTPSAASSTICSWSGLFEPAEGGVWQIADYQARLIAAFIKACEDDPKRAAWFRALKARAHPDIGHGIRWKDTPWHRFEIQHYRFRSYMKRLLRKFGAPVGRRRSSRISCRPKALPGADAKLKLAS